MFGLEFIKKLKPCTWYYKAHLDDDKRHFGFIAQEVDEVAPSSIYNFAEIGEDEIYRINYHEFIAPIVKAIQELDERITKLERESNGAKHSTGSQLEHN